MSIPMLVVMFNAGLGLMQVRKLLLSEDHKTNQHLYRFDSPEIPVLRYFL